MVVTLTEVVPASMRTAGFSLECDGASSTALGAAVV
jgi:hypothetical protein